MLIHIGNVTSRIRRLRLLDWDIAYATGYPISTHNTVVIKAILRESHSVFKKSGSVTVSYTHLLQQVQQLLQLYDSMKQDAALLQEASILQIGSSITIANELLDVYKRQPLSSNKP